MGVGAFIVCRLPPRARPPLRHFAAICALTLLGCAAASAATRAEPWRIDAAHTSIAFRVDAVGFPQTHGHFTRYSGRILFLDGGQHGQLDHRHQRGFQQRLRHGHLFFDG